MKVDAINSCSSDRIFLDRRDSSSFRNIPEHLTAGQILQIDVWNSYKGSYYTPKSPRIISLKYYINNIVTVRPYQKIEDRD